MIDNRFINTNYSLKPMQLIAALANLAIDLPDMPLGVPQVQGEYENIVCQVVDNNPLNSGSEVFYSIDLDTEDLLIWDTADEDNYPGYENMLPKKATNRFAWQTYADLYNILKVGLTDGWHMVEKI